MASNFMIQHRRRKNRLHLKLSGDFDGSSACELNDCLQKALRHEDRIIIHTGRLKSLPMFGCEMFHKQFGFHARAAERVLFTGAYAPRIAPEGYPTQR